MKALLGCSPVAVCDHPGGDQPESVHRRRGGASLPDGTLVIVDRKMNICKLAEDEYVAVEAVENNALGRRRFVLHCCTSAIC